MGLSGTTVLRPQQKYLLFLLCLLCFRWYRQIASYDDRARKAFPKAGGAPAAAAAADDDDDVDLVRF